MLPILAMLTSEFIIDAIEVFAVVYVGTGAVIDAAGCVAATATSAGTSSPVTAPVAALTATAAIGIIGYSATTTAVGMCALAGGVFAGKSMLNSLRDNYIATQITKNSDGKVTKLVLKRK